MIKLEKKYTSDNTLEYILQKLPEYQGYLDECLLYWGSDKTTIHTHMTYFGRFTRDLIESKNYVLLPKIFAIIETLIVYGDEDVDNAASLCFLESVMTVSGNSPKEVPYASYIPLLGPESRKVCKELDEFWGYQTPGLWKVGEKFNPTKREDTSSLPEIPDSWKE